MKSFLVILLLAIVATVVWMLRDTEPVHRLMHLEVSLPAINLGNDTQPGLRKCKKGHQVLYTNGPCPDGSKELPIDGDNVTVLPKQETTKLPATAGQAASRPNSQ